MRYDDFQKPSRIKRRRKRGWNKRSLHLTEGSR